MDGAAEGRDEILVGGELRVGWWRWGMGMGCGVGCSGKEHRRDKEGVRRKYRCRSQQKDKLVKRVKIDTNNTHGIKMCLWSTSVHVYSAA